MTPIASENDGIQTTLGSDLAGPVFMNVPGGNAMPLAPFSIPLAATIQFIRDLAEGPPLSISKFDDDPNDFHLN